jgi:hypothetical protein
VSTLESEDVNHPLLYTLKEAEDTSWTGIFKVLKDSDQIGVVVMHEGRMAWASSTRQTENLGSFLEKIGMIPKERQKEIVDQVKALGKTKELGALLEETGLISSSKLRECIRMQIRTAVDSLIAAENIEIISEECEINVNPDFVFRMNEALPDKIVDASDYDFSKSDYSENRKETNGLQNVLKNLASLTGYQYSFIYDLKAKVLASHKSDTLAGNFEEIMDFSISWIISSNTALNDSDMGRIEFILLEHDKGSLVAQWPNIDGNLFVAASFDKNGKPGVIRHKISEMIPAILHITGESH